MLSLVVLAALQQEGTLFRQSQFDGPLGHNSVMILAPVERVKPPRMSVKTFGEPPRPWEFDWNVAGYSQIDGGQQLRFDLWSQESTVGNTRPDSVVRTLLQLYSYNYGQLRIVHSKVFEGIVTVFLCYGGQPGGEQTVEVRRLASEDVKLNSIYLYDLKSLTDPVEALREVAHEYGHATLPPIGGFDEPEDWSNGYLGEKVYLSYLAKALKAKKLSPEDTMGATAEQVEDWTKKNVDPLVAQAALNGPNASLLAGRSKASMDSLIGLALWTRELYGPRTMIRALAINGTSATDFPSSASTAAAEPAQATLNIPASLVGKPVWIPIGEDKKRNLLLGAQELTPRKNGWVKIRPGKTIVVVRNHNDA